MLLDLADQRLEFVNSRHGSPKPLGRLRRVYWAVPSFPGFEFTYLSGARVIAVDPWREEDPAHARLVDAAPRPAFVTGGRFISKTGAYRNAGIL